MSDTTYDHAERLRSQSSSGMRNQNRQENTRDDTDVNSNSSTERNLLWLRIHARKTPLRQVDNHQVPHPTIQNECRWKCAEDGEDDPRDVAPLCFELRVDETLGTQQMWRVLVGEHLPKWRWARIGS